MAKRSRTHIAAASATARTDAGGGGAPPPAGSTGADRPAAILAYVALAYGITWLAVAPLALDALGWLHLGLSPYWHGLAALGPIGAALLVTARTEGRSGVAALLSRLLRPPRQRHWLAVALLTPPALLLIGIIAARLTGAPWPDGAELARRAAAGGWWLDLTIASVLFGFGEEPGWRGFLQERLQRRFAPLLAALMVGAVWAAWHTPFFTYRFAFGGAGTVVGFFLSMLAGALWLAYLYNASGRSLLVVALWHTLWNVVSLVAAALGSTVVAVTSMLVFALAVGALVAGGPLRLGLEPASEART